MPEWLQSPFKSDANLSLAVLVTRMAVAFALGFVIAGIYRITRGRAASGSGGGGRGETLNLMATLVLLTILICMITMVIGDNIARAFSLAGALAIVRFRTVVEDTRDTAFVIFAVAVGMAVGAGYLIMPLVCIPFAGAAAALARPREQPSGGDSGEFVLTLRVGSGFAADAALRDGMNAHLAKSHMVSTGTTRMGAAIERVYAVRLSDQTSADALIAKLNAVEGVQGVELRRA